MYEIGESSLGKGPEEGDEFFSLSGRDVHKIQTNIELMFPLALELVVPEHLGFNGPRVPFTRGRKCKNKRCITRGIIVQMQMVPLN